MNPRYTHDCDRCIFLGQFKEYDLYFADHGGLAPGFVPIQATVIARYGNDGPEYTSGLSAAMIHPALIEAKRLALAGGLLAIEAT